MWCYILSSDHEVCSLDYTEVSRPALSCTAHTIIEGWAWGGGCACEYCDVAIQFAHKVWHNNYKQAEILTPDSLVWACPNLCNNHAGPKSMHPDLQLDLSLSMSYTVPVECMHTHVCMCMCTAMIMCMYCGHNIGYSISISKSTIHRRQALW